MTAPKSKSIPVVDLFAGPGGLGEGFSARFSGGNRPAFKIVLSIEKDPVAHSTLELRSFFRQFATRQVPDDYYRYLRGEIARNEMLERHPNQAAAAAREAWCAELGVSDDDEVDRRIAASLAGAQDWVLIGGPPCQAYSLVGRSRMRGEDTKKFELDHRHFLYREYLRILAVHRPPVFVMENVKGLLSASVEQQGMFECILKDLASPSAAIACRRHGQPLKYRLVSLTKPSGNVDMIMEPEDFVVKTEQFGIPQARHRVIILGIRADIAAQPSMLILAAAPAIEDVIGDLPRLRSGLSKELDASQAWRDVLLAIRGAAWLRDSKVGPHLRQEILGMLREVDPNLDRGGEWMQRTRRVVHCYREWFIDEQLNGVCNHSTRSHIREDLHRYFFVSAFARIHNRSPLLNDFPKMLLPKHGNVAEALVETKFNDRFRVQFAGRPSTTITSHISKDGHYFIHYDPTQCRSLTVREAARVQTFPDSYFFEGPRTQQYHQVGNAVPPLLARQIAGVVARLLR